MTENKIIYKEINSFSIYKQQQLESVIEAKISFKNIQNIPGNKLIIYV